jgi:hypothetical protein
MMKLSRIALTLGFSIALQAMALLPPPTEIQIPASTPAIQDPVFQKLFSTTKLEGVFQSSLVNVDGFKVEIHINGVGKNLIADLVTKKVALDGRSGEPAATGIRASVSVVEDLGGLVMHENPPFEYLQLNQQVIEDRASTSAQTEIYRESRLLGNIQSDRMACLRELYSRFYRGWMVRVQLGEWREDYYFFYPRNSNQLLALAAIKIRPVPNDSEAIAILNRVQPLYGFRSEGTLVNGFYEGASRGSIWFQEVGDSDRSRSAAPDPKGIKKLWISPSWSPYVTRLFDLARTKWLDQKRQVLGLPTNQDVIEAMLTNLGAQIERPGELGAAMAAFNKLSHLVEPKDQSRLMELNTQLIKATQREEEARAADQAAAEEARRSKAESEAKAALQAKSQPKQAADADALERARKNLCEWYGTRDYLQKLVEHENQVQAASGVTDMRKRYELGQSLVMANQLIKEGRATFKKLFRREFNRAKDCK